MHHFLLVEIDKRLQCLDRSFGATAQDDRTRRRKVPSELSSHRFGDEADMRPVGSIVKEVTQELDNVVFVVYWK